MKRLKLRKHVRATNNVDAAVYSRTSVKSENFNLADFLLPPCSDPQRDRTRKAYRQNGRTVEYDATPTYIHPSSKLTPVLIDKLVEHTLRTHSMECAGWAYCVPYFTLRQWLDNGARYAKDLTAGNNPNAGHILCYELYMRLNHAKYLKLSEKRARIMRESIDFNWTRTLKVLEKIDREDFRTLPDISLTKDNTPILPDESYM